MKSTILPVHRQSLWLRRMTSSTNDFKREQARRAAAKRQGDKDESSVIAFKRSPVSLWIGYSYQLYPVSGRFQITLRLTGLLPDGLQNDRSINMFLRVKLQQSECEEKIPDLCIVKRGVQLKASTVCFNNQTIQTLTNTDVQFTAYIIKGRLLKRKEVITKWTVPIDTSKVLRSHCDWKNIQHLYNN